MKTIEVETPQGVVWQVRVAWRPRWSALVRRFGGWRRKRKGQSSPADALDPSGGCQGCDGDLGAVLVGIVLFIVGGLVFWFLLLPLLLLVVDVLVIIVLLAASIPARVLLRRPWTVEAVSDDGQAEKIFSTDVVGWRRAITTRDDIASKLTMGFPAPIVGTLRTRPIAPPQE